MLIQLSTVQVKTICSLSTKENEGTKSNFSMDLTPMPQKGVNKTKIRLLTFPRQSDHTSSQS